MLSAVMQLSSLRHGISSPPTTKSRHLADDGRLVTGFGAGRGYDFGTFLEDAAVAGLESQQKFSTWDLRPFAPDSDFLVAFFGVRT